MSNTPTLTLCMIAKNEEAHLTRCLESVRDLADDIVLVDTGSTDRTVEIAHAFGARVFNVAWQDDFSLARNASLDEARGDWILSLDADETIAQRDHDVIRRLLEQRDLDAVIASQRHYLTSGTIVGWQPGSGGYDEGRDFPGFLDVECIRLFRNRPWLRFQNRVHEVIVSTDPARSLRTVRGSWVIHHFGKVSHPETLRSKAEAYLRIGVKKAEEQPRDPQAHYELGMQYVELNRLGEALSCFERTLALSPGYRDAPLWLAVCLSRLDQPKRALDALRVAARTLPQRAAEIALEEGNAHVALGDSAGAERAFKRAIAKQPGLVAAHVNLALVYQRQHRTSEALACLDRALEHWPMHTEALKLRARLRRDSGNDAGALIDLEQLGSLPEALRLRARILAQHRRFEDARVCLDTLPDDDDAELAGLRGAVALGLGSIDDAIAHLSRSVETDATHEAARNLATALEARGDRQGALEAAATALRLAPDDISTIDGFARLAGQTLRETRRDYPSDPLTIFFCQPRSVPFDARTPRTRGLGGTESALVYLAEALVRRGHRVAVFNNCDEPGVFESVEYARWEELPARCLADRPAVVVSVRHWQTIGRVRLAPLQIFWTGDAFDQDFVRQLADPRAREEIDLFMLQSDWQIDTFLANHDLPAWRIARTILGSAASAVTPAAASASLRVQLPRPRRLAYASTPFRGLDVLLDVFPRIRAACPDAELDVFSSMRVYGVSEAEDRARYGALYRKADQPGVNLIGSVSQIELADRLGHARILAYPNHYPETFCIAAVEAQAAGCVVITSQLGALPETVGDAGICITGDPRSAAYRQAFVDACVGLLIDDERWLAMSERATARAWGKYTWTGIAAEWEALCRTALRPEPAAVQRIAVHLAAGRAGLAQKMLQRETPPASMPEAAWQSLHAFTAWRAGAGVPPSIEDLRHLALHVPTLRRALVDEDADRPSAESARNLAFSR